MPYCPLCKTEYRPGFDRCSDCLIKLCSREEADATKVSLLWEGASISKFNEVVAALQAAKIPSHSRSGAKAERVASLASPFDFAFRSFWSRGWWTRMRELKEQMSWLVYVLEADYERAQHVITEKQS